MSRSRTLGPSLLLALLALPGCPRGERMDVAKPDDAAKLGEKKGESPGANDNDPCRGGARPPTWKIAKTHAADPEIELEQPVFSSKCKLVEGDLNAKIDDLVKAGVEQHRKYWREAKADPTTFFPAGWAYDDKCKPEHVSTKVVSLSCSSYQASGGAHGLGGAYGRTFVIDGTKVREVELGGFFAKGWEKKLAARVLPKINAIKAERGGDPVTADEVEKGLGGVILHDASIELLWGPYAIGSYAEGEYAVTLKFAEVDDLLAGDGPIAKMPR